jgi:hypothetical protein
LFDAIVFLGQILVVWMINYSQLLFLERKVLLKILLVCSDKTVISVMSNAASMDESNDYATKWKNVVKVGRLELLKEF